MSSLHDLDLPEQIFQMANPLKMENNCANPYQNPSKIVGIMVQQKKKKPSNGTAACDGEQLSNHFKIHSQWTDARMHIHCTVIVTTVSPQAGLTKRVENIV